MSATITYVLVILAIASVVVATYYVGLCRSWGVTIWTGGVGLLGTGICDPSDRDCNEAIAGAFSVAGAVLETAGSMA